MSRVEGCIRYRIFADTNLFMYACQKRSHPIQDPAQQFFVEANRNGTPLCTSEEVLQELAHAYLLPTSIERLDSAMALIRRFQVEVWTLEHVDLHPGPATP